MFSDSPPVGEGDSLERINQLKALNMKNLRELMIKSKTMNPEAFADGAGSPRGDVSVRLSLLILHHHQP